MGIAKAIFHLFKDALSEFFKDRASIYAAGLAYYTVFSLAPLLVFITAVAGLFIGRSTASAQITTQLQLLIGPDLAGFVEGIVATLTDRTAGTTATVISVVALIFGASGIFRQLKTALNLIWAIPNAGRPKNRRQWIMLLRYRAVPFLMVFLFGLLLTLAVMIETIIAAVSARFEALFPEIGVLLPSLSRLLVPSLTFVTFLLIFKFLPDARSRWRDVAVGAAVTTGLFVIGRLLLNVFLSFSDTGSIYGAAGSVVILLFWVYYSAQILLYGAEFTEIYARRYGVEISGQWVVDRGK